MKRNNKGAKQDNRIDTPSLWAIHIEVTHSGTNVIFFFFFICLL